MITLLNSLPEWLLALLGVLLLLIAALYVWILVNWLALRQRVFELVEQNNQLARAIEAQAPVEQLYEDARQNTRKDAPQEISLPTFLKSPPDEEQVAARAAEREATQAAVRNLQNQLNVAHAQLAHTNRAVQLRQVALDEAHRRLITYEGTIADLQSALRQVEVAPVALADSSSVQAEPQNDDVNNDDVTVDPDESPINDLTARLQDANDRIEARDARVAELEAQLTGLQAEFNHAQAELDRISEIANAQLDEPPVAQEQARPVVDEAVQAADLVPIAPLVSNQPAQPSANDAHIQATLTLAQEAVESRDATIAEIKTQLGNVRSSLEMARETLQAREMELAQAKAAPPVAAVVDTSAHDAQVAELEKQLADLQQQLDAHRQTADNNNLVLAERISTISDLNHELDAQETQLTEAQEALTAKDAELADALSKLDEQNATIADLLSDVKAANETVSLLQSQVDNLSAQLTELQTAAEQASDDAPAVNAQREAEFETQRNELEQQLQGAQAAYTELDGQMEALRARVAEVEAQLQQSQAEAESANAKLASRIKRMDALKIQLEAAQAELAARPASTPQATTPISPRSNGLTEADTTVPARLLNKRKADADAEVETTPDEDALTDIVGIGAVYAKRLSKAGISTYKALAKTKRSQLEKIIQPSKLQNIDFDDWIEQAKAKAKAAKR